MSLKLVIKRVSGGLWRWQLFHNSLLIAMPPVSTGLPMPELVLEQARTTIANILGGPRWFALWRAKRIPYEFTQSNSNEH